MDRLGFYLRHSFNDMRVNGRRTLFAVLCIAAGVAAVVGLQTIGVAIGNTVDNNQKERNRSDIRLAAPTAEADLPEGVISEGLEDGTISRFATGFGYVEYNITEEGVNDIREDIEQQHPGAVEEVTYRQQVVDPRKAGIRAPDRATQGEGVSLYVVERDRYPLYGEIESTDGLPLAELLGKPTDVVLNEKLAKKLKVKTGDEVRLTGSEERFFVRGIVADNVETDAENPDLARTGYLYLDVGAAPLFDREESAAQVFVKLAGDAPAAEINAGLEGRYPYLNTTTAEELVAQNEANTALVAPLVTTVGFLSLLVGGIGIVNTMQVVVRRRTLEVAVLKTIGLQGRQVTLLFLVEALLMGVIGTLAGVVLGLSLVFLLRGPLGAVLGLDLDLGLSPGPVLAGIVTGLVVTTAFGFLPTLSAAGVRPALVLRPTDAAMPRAGRLQTLVVVLLIVAALGAIAVPIFGNPVLAVGSVAGAFVAAGVVYALLWLAITLAGRFAPTFGVADLKVSLRAMLSGRARATMTLLALATGVLVLGLTVLLASIVSRQLDATIVSSVGGNAMVAAPSDIALRQVEEVLDADEVPGVRSHATSSTFDTVLKRVESRSGETTTLDDVRTRIEKGGGIAAAGDLGFTFSSLGGREPTPEFASQPVSEGRQLRPGDANKAVMVLEKSPTTDAAGIGVGDRLTYALGGEDGPEVTFEVVGLREIGSFSYGATSYAPRGAFPGSVEPSFNDVAVDVEEAQLGALEERMKRIPEVDVMETRELNKEVQDLTRQATTFPILVAAVSLLVSAVVIANSVALSTTERRREIAVMKAVGARRERVLGMLLAENALLGLIGGLVGVGIALAALLALQTWALPSPPGQEMPIIVPYGPAFLLALLCVGVALGAAMVTAWGASGEKPLNVLRHE